MNKPTYTSGTIEWFLNFFSKTGIVKDGQIIHAVLNQNSVGYYPTKIGNKLRGKIIADSNVELYNIVKEKLNKNPNDTIAKEMEAALNSLHAVFCNSDSAIGKDVGSRFKMLVTLTPTNSSKENMAAHLTTLTIFLLENGVNEDRIDFLISNLKTVNLTVLEPHELETEECESVEAPKSAVRTDTDARKSVIAAAKAAIAAKQAQLDNGSGNNEEQLNDNPTPTEEQINAALTATNA